MKSLKIGIDIDGVIVDLVSAMLPLLSEACGKQVAHNDIYCFDIGKALSIEEKMTDIWAEVYSSDVLRNAPPIQGAIDGLNQLTPHEIWLITGRPQQTRGNTKKWFSSYEVKYNYLKFVQRGEKHLLSKEVDIFIEDNLEEVVSISRAGTKSLLLDKPWNKENKQNSTYTRVNNWDGILCEINKMTE